MTASHLHPSWRVIPGDCRKTLATLDAGSVQTCVTSPPYFGLRDYGHEDQIGREPTPDEFVTAIVDVFREVRRVLADDGTVWLNLGDSYNNRSAVRPSSHRSYLGHENESLTSSWAENTETGLSRPSLAADGLKEKDLIGVPWMAAFALRADGWWLRSDIVWAKSSCLPEPVRDRPTKSHEYLFLLSKSKRYFYDGDAIKEPHVSAEDSRNREDYAPKRLDADTSIINGGARKTTHGPSTWPEGGRNKRSVWTVAPAMFPDAHFATFPPKLIEPCILAGCPEGGTVLDPFAGAGTTGMVALRHGRSFVGCELNADYVALARDRIIADSPLLNTHAEAA